MISIFYGGLGVILTTTRMPIQLIGAEHPLTI